MSKLYIIGAGGFGREVYSWLKHMPDWDRSWTFAGFLDDNPCALDKFALPYGIVGRPRTFEFGADDHAVCAIADPKLRLEICRPLRARGVSFPVIRHPSVIMGEDCRIGAGCVLCPGVIITTNVTLGEFVIANVLATVGHDTVIGDGTTLSGHVDVTGCGQVGEGVFFGSHAAALPGAKIGAFARIGAGSVVLRSVNTGASVIGVPAKQFLP